MGQNLFISSQRIKNHFCVSLMFVESLILRLWSFNSLRKKILTFAKIIFAFIIQSVYIWHRMCITVKRLLSTHKKYTVLYWVGPNSINTTFWLQVEENLMVGWFCFTGRNCAVPNQFHLLQGWYWVESVKLKNKLVWSWCWPHS